MSGSTASCLRIMKRKSAIRTAQPPKQITLKTAILRFVLIWRARTVGMGRVRIIRSVIIFCRVLERELRKKKQEIREKRVRPY